MARPVYAVIDEDENVPAVAFERAEDAQAFAELRGLYVAVPMVLVSAYEWGAQEHMPPAVASVVCAATESAVNKMMAGAQ